jgi:tRNA(Ile)-lysidine synthetase-like protein
VRRLLAGDGAPCGPVSGHELARGLAILREPVVPPATLPVTDRAVTSPGWGIRVHRAVRGEGWSSPVPPGSRLMIRSRRPGDRVRTRAGTRKVSDVLVDAKVPRALRDFVPVLASADGALAVVGLTRYAGGGEGMVCVQPDRPSWSRAVVWS